MKKEVRYFNLWLKNANRRDEDEWEEMFFCVRTEVQESQAFNYGNGKCGAVFLLSDKTGNGRGQFIESYDLRYSDAKDLHVAMIESYWGKNLKAYYEYDGSQGLVPMPGTQAWVYVPHEEKKKVRL